MEDSRQKDRDRAFKIFFQLSDFVLDLSGFPQKFKCYVLKLQTKADFTVSTRLWEEKPSLPFFC